MLVLTRMGRVTTRNRAAYIYHRSQSNSASHVSCDFTTYHNVSSFLDKFREIWHRSLSTADWGGGRGTGPQVGLLDLETQSGSHEFFPNAEAVRGNVWKTRRGEAAGLKGVGAGVWKKQVNRFRRSGPMVPLPKPLRSQERMRLSEKFALNHRPGSHETWTQTQICLISKPRVLTRAPQSVQC